MAIMALSEVREHVETGLSDAALAKVIEGADQEIIHHCGAVETQTDEIPVYPNQYNKWIWLTRAVGSITSVIETVGVSDTILASDDYRLYHESQLKRLDDGTNSRSYWGDRVKVVYVPRNDINRRRLALIKLITLSVTYTGNSSERSGDFACTALGYQAEHDKIIASLKRKGMFA